MVSKMSSHHKQHPLTSIKQRSAITPLPCLREGGNPTSDAIARSMTNLLPVGSSTKYYTRVSFIMKEHGRNKEADPLVPNIEYFFLDFESMEEIRKQTRWCLT